MAHLPLAVSGAIIIGGSVVVAVGGLLFLRLVLHLPRDKGAHDVAGFLYAVIGVIYGVLLAFVVFAVWQRYDAIDQAVTAEAADLVAVFRDTQTFPPPLQAEAQAALRTYANEVMTTEWNDHGTLTPHRTPDLLNPLYAIYRQIQPTTQWGMMQQDDANQRLHQLEVQRHLRHLSGESTLPTVFWPVLIIGGIVTIAFSYFFHLEQLWGQVLMTALLTAIIASLLFLIVNLNDPFTGRVHVSRYPFEHALQQFVALNLQHPIPAGTPVAVPVTGTGGG